MWLNRAQRRIALPDPISLSAESQFKAIVATSPIPTAVSHFNGTVVHANHAFACTFGMTLPEVIGSHIPDYYYDPGDIAPILDLLKRNGRVQAVEIKAKKRDGTPVWALVSVAVIELDGDIFDLIEFNDITERKQIEEKLAQRTRSLEALNQLARNVTATLDLEVILHTAVKTAIHLLDVTSAYISAWNETNQTMTVIAEQNTMARQGSKLNVVYDLKADPDITMDWLWNLRPVNLSHLEDADLSPKARAHMMTYGCRSALEVPLRTKDTTLGTLELWESRARRDFTQEEIELAQAIASHVALAINNARLYEQTKEANRLKIEFLAKVSHELRTPLGVILGYAEMLQEGLYGALSGTQGEILHYIVENTAALTHEVNNLLDAARLEAGKLHLTPDTFLREDMLNRIQNQFGPQASLKNLTFTIKISDNAPETLYGDWRRVEQIVYNLLQNALKYTQTGGITLCVDRPDKDHWALVVTDTGSGIPAEAQSTIFEPFRQADDTATRSHPGQGLGLTIVRQLVHLMHGEVYLESQVGRGSSFTILLPLKKEG